MRKSKIIFLFKIFITLLFIIAIVRIITFNNKYKLYKNTGSNKGIITNVTKKKSYVVADIKSSINYKAYFDKSSNVDIGDIIYFEYDNKALNMQKIFNAFDYYKYLKSKNINQIIQVKKYKIVGTNKKYYFNKYISRLIHNKKSKAYIYTFLCGDKSYIDSDIKMTYTSNGISHLLCVSGFHVVFILGLIKNFFRKIFKRDSIPLLIIFSLFYLILTNFMIPLFRAVLMYFSNEFNKRLNINISNLYYYFIILFLIIIIKPYGIFDVGFYYTFIISFFLIINKYNLNNIFKTTIYCFLISMPITLFLNYNINLLSIIFNVLSSFFVCYILYTFSFISIFSNVIDKLTYQLSTLFEFINLKINTINIFRIIFPKTNIYLVMFIYILYFIYIFKPNIKYFCIYFIVVFYILFNKYFNQNTYVYFIDVGQGDMAVLISKNYKNITIIDTGGLENNTYLKYSLRSFLYSVGVSKINNLILSHGDYDHMGEAINLVNNFKIEKVIFNCGPFNDLEKEINKVLDKKKIKYYTCIKELNIDKNKFYFLQTKEYDNENDNSNVIYTELNGYKFMFMGDASSATEHEILSKYNLPDIDVLKVGHHGSKTSSSNEFINKINPKYSVLSVGKNNRYGHPNKEVLENLENSKIYRTDEDGSIMFKIKNNKLKIVTCSP